MIEKIVVIGGGGHAKVIISILKKLKHFDIVGYTDFENKGAILGTSYLGADDKLPGIYKNGVKNAVIGLGQLKSSELRRKLYNSAMETGFILPPVISPGSIINEDTQIGQGTVIMDGVVINAGTRIGECSIINTNSSVDHDCIIGDFTHIAPGVTLSGEAQVGNDVLIGTGSNIIQQISIPDYTIISAGSTVLKSIERKGIYRGNPAEFLRDL